MVSKNHYTVYVYVVTIWLEDWTIILFYPKSISGSRSHLSCIALLHWHTFHLWQCLWLIVCFRPNCHCDLWCAAITAKLLNALVRAMLTPPPQYTNASTLCVVCLRSLNLGQWIMVSLLHNLWLSQLPARRLIDPRCCHQIDINSFLVTTATVCSGVQYSIGRIEKSSR